MHHTRLQAQSLAGSMERPVHHRICPRMDDSSIYHSLRRESIKNTNSASATGVKSVRPTWFENIVIPKNLHLMPNRNSTMHGLKLVVKEEALSCENSRNSQHFFPSNAFMASARSFNTFNCMLQIMLQVLISAYTWPSTD